MWKHWSHRILSFLAKNHLRDLIINSLFTDVDIEAQRSGGTHPGSHGKAKTKNQTFPLNHGLPLPTFSTLGKRGSRVTCLRLKSWALSAYYMPGMCWRVIIPHSIPWMPCICFLQRSSLTVLVSILSSQLIHLLMGKILSLCFSRKMLAPARCSSDEATVPHCPQYAIIFLNEVRSMRIGV